MEGITVLDMLQAGRILSPGTLSLELQDAYRHLISEPGPHLSQRRETAEKWLPWWINYLHSLPSPVAPLVPSPKIMALDSVIADGDAGILFVAGAEGHEGHRFASHWMKRHVKKTIWLFEEDAYLQQKERGGSFLPLEVRLSMWSHHPDIDTVSVTPLADRQEFPDLSTFYRYIFDRTGAGYCFATEDDPNLESKRLRGKPAWFTRIPSLPVPGTTQRVEKLMPDIESVWEKYDEDSYLLRDPFFPWDAYEEFRRTDAKYL